MSQRLRRLLRDYTAIASGELVSKVAGFAAFAYLARVLAPEGYGAVELAVAVGMVGYLIVDFGAGPIGARWVTQDRGRASAAASAIPAIRFSLALVCFAGACAAALLLADSAQGRLLIIAYGAALIGAPWILDWLFQGLDRMRWVAPAQMLRMCLFAGAVVVFVREPGDVLRVGAIEIAAFGSMALYYVIAARALGQHPGLRSDRETLRALWTESVPVGIGQLLWALNQYLPTFVLAWLLSSREVAFYGAAHRVVFSLGSFIFLYFFTLYPSLVRAVHERPAEFAPLCDHSLRATAWLGLLAALVGSLLAEPLCRLAFGERFAEAGPVLAVLVWALPINLLSGHARFALIAAGEQSRQMWAQAGGVGVTVVASIVLVRAIGALGAAIALVASALAVWVIAHLATRRHVGALPGLAPLVRPVASALAVLAAARLAPADAPWTVAGGAAALYLAAGVALERETLRTLPALLGFAGGEPNGASRAQSASGATSREQGASGATSGAQSASNGAAAAATGSETRS